MEANDNIRVITTVNYYYPMGCAFMTVTPGKSRDKQNFKLPFETLQACQQIDKSRKKRCSMNRCHTCKYM